MEGVSSINCAEVVHILSSYIERAAACIEADSINIRVFLSSVDAFSFSWLAVLYMSTVRKENVLQGLARSAWLQAKFKPPQDWL